MNLHDELKNLISMATSVDKADHYIEEFTAFKGFKEKLQYLIEHFEVEVIARCDSEDASDEQRIHDDYYAVLNTIVNEKWR